jgi:hypothetical protein
VADLWAGVSGCGALKRKKYLQMKEHEQSFRVAVPGAWKDLRSFPPVYPDIGCKRDSWGKKRWKCIDCLQRRWGMPKPRRAGSDLEVKIQTEESQDPIACRYGFLSMSSIFIRKTQLPLGTHVVVKICNEQCGATLHGIVSANYPDLGQVIQFTETTNRTVRELGTLLATWRM